MIFEVEKTMGETIRLWEQLFEIVKSSADNKS